MSVAERFAPIGKGRSPFLADIVEDKINQFFQSRIIWKDTLVFSHFTYLSMISFHCVGSVDDAPDGIRKPEISRKFIPVLRHDFITMG